MTPFVELKFAIPLGFKLGLSGITTIIFATTGTLIPSAIGLAVAEPLSNYLRKKFQLMERFFNYTFTKTRTEHSKNFDRYGALFILLFVAIPLPGSGSSAGALIAFIFGVDYWKALFLVTVGTILAAIMLTLGTGSIFAFFNALQ